MIHIDEDISPATAAKDIAKQLAKLNIERVDGKAK